jgi:hypothetical protein
MTVFTIETLNALGARLLDHADSITNVARHDMEVDVRLAARVCSNMATLRFRIGEIADAEFWSCGACSSLSPAPSVPSASPRLSR